MTPIVFMHTANETSGNYYRKIFGNFEKLPGDLGGRNFARIPSVGASTTPAKYLTSWTRGRKNTFLNFEGALFPHFVHLRESFFGFWS